MAAEEFACISFSRPSNASLPVVVLRRPSKIKARLAATMPLGVFLQGPASHGPPAAFCRFGCHWSGPGPSLLDAPALARCQSDRRSGSGTDPGTEIKGMDSGTEGHHIPQPIEGEVSAAPSRRPHCPGHSRRIWRPWRPFQAAPLLHFNARAAGRKWVAGAAEATAEQRTDVFRGEHVDQENLIPTPSRRPYSAQMAGLRPTRIGARQSSAGQGGLSSAPKRPAVAASTAPEEPRIAAVAGGPAGSSPIRPGSQAAPPWRL